MTQTSRILSDEEAGNYKTTWNQGNNAGDGYGVGAVSDSLLDAAAAEGLTDIAVEQPGGWTWTDAHSATQFRASMVVGKDERGNTIIIRDLNGPWAVQA